MICNIQNSTLYIRNILLKDRQTYNLPSIKQNHVWRDIPKEMRSTIMQFKWGTLPIEVKTEWVHCQQLVYRFYNSDINAKSKLNWNWTYLAT